MTPSFLVPLSDIEPKLKEMQSFLEQTYAAEEGSEVVERMQMAEHYMSLSGKLFADAKYYRDRYVDTAIMDTVKEALKQGNWSTSVINKKIDAMSMDLNYLVNWAERTNRSCTHCIELCRTLISKQKAEMHNFRQTDYTL